MGLSFLQSTAILCLEKKDSGQVCPWATLDINNAEAAPHFLCRTSPCPLSGLIQQDDLPVRSNQSLLASCFLTRVAFILKPKLLLVIQVNLFTEPKAKIKAEACIQVNSFRLNLISSHRCSGCHPLCSACCNRCDPSDRERERFPQVCLRPQQARYWACTRYNEHHNL